MRDLKIVCNESGLTVSLCLLAILLLFKSAAVSRVDFTLAARGNHRVLEKADAVHWHFGGLADGGGRFFVSKSAAAASYRMK
jgi:hypothetical protein